MNLSKLSPFEPLYDFGGSTFKRTFALAILDDLVVVVPELDEVVPDLPELKDVVQVVVVAQVQHNAPLSMLMLCVDLLV